MLLPLSKSVVAANATLAVLAILAVGLRLVARRKRNIPLKADDYLIVVALASFRVFDLIFSPN